MLHVGLLGCFHHSMNTFHVLYTLFTFENNYNSVYFGFTLQFRKRINKTEFILDIDWFIDKRVSYNGR